MSNEALRSLPQTGRSSGLEPAGIAPTCDHDAMKATHREWIRLEFRGYQRTKSGQLELRNCTCGSTLGVPVPPAQSPMAALAALGLDVVDVAIMATELRETLAGRTADLIELFGGEPVELHAWHLWRVAS